MIIRNCLLASLAALSAYPTDAAFQPTSVHKAGKNPVTTHRAVVASPAADPTCQLPDPPTSPAQSIHWPSTAPSQHMSPKGPSEYQLNLGRVIDTLRHDYPLFFISQPDFSIFVPEVELHDPSGMRIRGLKQYSRIFDMIRFLRRTTMQDAQLTYRLVVTGDTVRVRWSAKLWMRDPAFGMSHTFNGDPAVIHIDGISAYDINTKGLVRSHRLENIVLSGPNNPQRVVSLRFAWPVPGMATPEMAIPFFKLMGQALTRFESERTDTGGAALLPAPLPSPLRPSEKRADKPRVSADVVAHADERPKAQRKQQQQTKNERGRGLFGWGPQQCETSWDCESPQVCCDLIFASICCDGGLLNPVDPRPIPQPIPIPIPVDPNPYPYPVPPRRNYPPY